MADPIAPYTSPPTEIRVLRIGIGVALIGAMLYALRHLFSWPIIEANKLEFGMILGWLVSKAGTVVDWLFGASESGGRRADLSSHQAALAPPMSQAKAPATAAAAAQDTATAAQDEADTITDKAEEPTP